VCLRRALVCLAAAVLIFGAGRDASAAFSGAIYTSKGDGTVVNQNLYDLKSDVYLNGGPQNIHGAGLPDGVYYFQVTDPSGQTLLSTDDAECRRLVVSGGVVSGALPNPPNTCPHTNGTLNPLNGSTPVQLIPFLDTPNPGGEYKVWLIPVSAATIDGVDPRVLIFDGGNSKTDNFKVKEPEVTGSTISGEKFYDVNVNGVLDPGEVGIPGWKIEADIPSNTTTDVNGNYEFLNVDPGTYQVCEVIPALAPTWIPTTPTSITGITVPPDSINNDFGNVCLGPGGGKTLGFWSNKNGEKVFGQIGGLTILNPLYLRNGAGGKVTPLASYSAFRSWILGASATNMAYMLSAQLAAMELNVGATNVSGGAIVYAGTCGNTGINNTFITISDLMSAAASQIQLHGLTTAASDPVNRPIQECLKNALDDANNNKNFVQATPCDVNYSGLESSCIVP
jgi:SdrD B-like domain